MKKLYNVLFLPDIHIPCEDESLVGPDGKMFKLLKKKKYDKIFQIGDLVDFDCLSRFENDPRTLNSLPETIHRGIGFLENLREHAPKAEIYWKEGNHDQRLEKYLIRKCPELLTLDCLNLKSLFDCDRLGIQFVPANVQLIVDGIKITHGTKVSQQSGYTAHAEMKQSKGRSGVSGHTHRYSMVHSHEATWMELGYLGSLDYSKYPYLSDNEPNWRQAFGEATCLLNEKEEIVWMFRLIEIVDGHFMVDGVLY